MKTTVNFSMDNTPVRFTDGGKIFVLDAISALSEISPANEIWKSLKIKNPVVDQYVQYHHLPGNTAVPITDGAGWEKIQILLFDYLIHFYQYLIKSEGY